MLHAACVPHGILLTEYKDGQFYCADPSEYANTGIIPIEEAWGTRVENSNAYWYVTSEVADPKEELVLAEAASRPPWPISSPPGRAGGRGREPLSDRKSLNKIRESRCFCSGSFYERRRLPSLGPGLRGRRKGIRESPLPPGSRPDPGWWRRWPDTGRSPRRRRPPGVQAGAAGVCRIQAQGQLFSVPGSPEVADLRQISASGRGASPLVGQGPGFVLGVGQKAL